MGGGGGGGRGGRGRGRDVSVAKSQNMHSDIQCKHVTCSATGEGVTVSCVVLPHNFYMHELFCRQA